MEQTLFLLKPDAVQRRLLGEILSRLERKGLRIVALKMMRIDRELAEQSESAEDELVPSLAHQLATWLSAFALELLDGDFEEKITGTMAANGIELSSARACENRFQSLTESNCHRAAALFQDPTSRQNGDRSRCCRKPSNNKS